MYRTNASSPPISNHTHPGLCTTIDMVASNSNMSLRPPNICPRSQSSEKVGGQDSLPKRLPTSPSESNANHSTFHLADRCTSLQDVLVGVGKGELVGVGEGVLVGVGEGMLVGVGVLKVASEVGVAMGSGIAVGCGSSSHADSTRTAIKQGKPTQTVGRTGVNQFKA